MKNESLWSPLSVNSLSQVPIKLRSWIRDPASMTKKLKQKWDDRFYITLLSQSLGEVFENELKISVSPLNSREIVREVIIGCCDRPYLFARSILPKNLFEGETANYFEDVGNAPLGQMLFKEKSLKRSEFEIAKISPSSKEHDWIKSFTEEAVWARRSVFSFMQKSLILTEIFLLNSL